MAAWSPENMGYSDTIFYKFHLQHYFSQLNHRENDVMTKAEDHGLKYFYYEFLPVRAFQNVKWQFSNQIHQLHVDGSSVCVLWLVILAMMIDYTHSQAVIVWQDWLFTIETTREDGWPLGDHLLQDRNAVSFLLLENHLIRRISKLSQQTACKQTFQADQIPASDPFYVQDMLLI